MKAQVLVSTEEETTCLAEHEDLLPPSLLSMPVDILVEIAGHLESFGDLGSFLSTSRKLNSLQELPEITTGKVLHYLAPIEKLFNSNFHVARRHRRF
jgi:hypothetical protein